MASRRKEHQEDAKFRVFQIINENPQMTTREIAQKIGISITNLSLLKTGKVKAIRFSTLMAICRELECQPGDILVYVSDNEVIS